MADYHAVLDAASQLPMADRLRLIDDLAASVPDDQPPALSEAWLKEIEQRSEGIDSGSVQTEAWVDIRRRLFNKHGVEGAN